MMEWLILNLADEGFFGLTASQLGILVSLNCGPHFGCRTGTGPWDYIELTQRQAKLRHAIVVRAQVARDM